MLAAFVNVPETKLRTWREIVNGVSAARVSKFLGKLNLAEGYQWDVRLVPKRAKQGHTMLLMEGISPMGVGLQEPSLT